MSFYKFFMDGVQVDDPIDWQDLEINFTESAELPGIVFSQVIPASFSGSGYAILLDAFETAVCNSIELKIKILEDGDYSDIFNGIIFLNNIVFDYHKGIADVELKDNSFLAKIQNNKDIKFKIDVARSKNDVAITPVTARDINFFTPSTGILNYPDVECYDVGETLRYLVQAMTDGELEAETTFLDSSGLVFCTGAAILSNGTDGFAPTMSFKDAFEELHKKLNISFIIETPLGENPVLKIEPLVDLYEETDNVTLEGVRVVKGEADRDKYYQLVKMGSLTFVEDASGFTFPSPTFLGTRQEEFHLLGVCNSSEVLDLSAQFVVDSNVIEDIIVNSVDTYNDNIFIVQTQRPSIDSATIFDEIVDFYYNGTLMNKAVSDNYFGSVPNSIAKFLGNGDDGFIAQKNTEETITVLPGGAFYDIEPVEYATEVSDPNGNYDNATYYFTAPLAGVYSFFASVRYYVDGLVRSASFVSETMTIKIELVRYTDNTFATELETISNEITYSLDAISTEINAQGGLFLDVNNTVRVRVSAQKVVATDVSGQNVSLVLEDSTLAPTGSEPQFRCVATENGGGVYATYNEDDVRRYLYTIDQCPMSATDFKSVVNNIGKYLGITGTITKKGWIKELSWNPFKQLADIQIRSKE